jgi:hypothetical protein
MVRQHLALSVSAPICLLHVGNRGSCGHRFRLPGSESYGRPLTHSGHGRPCELQRTITGIGSAGYPDRRARRYTLRFPVQGAEIVSGAAGAICEAAARAIFGTSAQIWPED